MTGNNELHLVFGTGPVGLAVTDELLRKGKHVRMVNRSGRAARRRARQLVGGDAAGKAFAREASTGPAHPQMD